MSIGSCDTSRTAQEATEAEVELLRVQLAEVDGQFIGKSFYFCLLYGFCPLFLPCSSLLAALEVELEMLHHRSGQLLDYVGSATPP